MNWFRKLIGLLKSALYLNWKPKRPHKVFLGNKVINCENITPLDSYSDTRLVFCLHNASWDGELHSGSHGNLLLVYDGIRVNLCETVVTMDVFSPKDSPDVYVNGINVATLQATPGLIDSVAARGGSVDVESRYYKLKETGFGYLSDFGETK